jgi:hypothetical protein
VRCGQESERRCKREPMTTAGPLVRPVESDGHDGKSAGRFAKSSGHDQTTAQHAVAPATGKDNAGGQFAHQRTPSVAPTRNRATQVDRRAALTPPQPLWLTNVTMVNLASPEDQRSNLQQIASLPYNEWRLKRRRRHRSTCRVTCLLAAKAGTPRLTCISASRANLTLVRLGTPFVRFGSS